MTYLRRRNLVGAAVAAAAIAVLAAWQLWPPWSAYRDTVVPRHTVAAGQRLTVDGQTWAVGDVRHLDRDAFGGPLPTGTVSTVVAVERSGAEVPDSYCVAVLTDGRNRWRGQVLGSGGCGGTGPLSFSFLVPSDVVATAMDLTALDGAILLRLQL